MASRGLVVVGWYHSHPYSEPRPSQNDVLSHKKYQDALTTESGDEPCVGLIISKSLLLFVHFLTSVCILSLSLSPFTAFHSIYSTLPPPPPSPSPSFPAGPNLGAREDSAESKIAVFWVLTVQQDGVKVSRSITTFSPTIRLEQNYIQLIRTSGDHKKFSY